MAITLDDSTIRAALEADILSAWSVVTIYDDPPQTEPKAADLPRAFVMLQARQPVRSAGTASLTQWSIPHTYQITGEFAWPSSGTINAAREARLNALLALLTETNFYAGYRYTIDEIPADPGEPTDAEQTYRAVLTMTVEVISSV